VNTAIAITAIIALMLLCSTLINAIRDIAAAKHQHCNGCTCRNAKDQP
jgi:hypothetical protein